MLSVVYCVPIGPRPIGEHLRTKQRITRLAQEEALPCDAAGSFAPSHSFTPLRHTIQSSEDWTVLEKERSDVLQ